MVNPLPQDLVQSLRDVRERLRRLELKTPAAPFIPVVMTSQQWAVKGRISVEMELPPIIVVGGNQYDGYTFLEDGSSDDGDLAPGPHLQHEEVYLIGLMAWIGAGTATLEVRSSPTPGSGHLFGGLTANSAHTTGDEERTLIEEVSDHDRLFLHCTATTGTPRRLTVAAAFAHLYGEAEA